MTSTDINALNKRQQSKFTRTIKSLEVEFDECEDDILEAIRRLVSGNIRTRTFIALGHPLGRRNAVTSSRMTKSGKTRQFRVTSGGGMVPILPINVQTNKMRSSLRSFRRKSGGRLTKRIYFTDPKAKFVVSLRGTKSTISRQFWETIRVFQKQRRKLMMKNVKSKAKK